MWRICERITHKETATSWDNQAKTETLVYIKALQVFCACRLVRDLDGSWQHSCCICRLEMESKKSGNKLPWSDSDDTHWTPPPPSPWMNHYLTCMFLSTITIMAKRRNGRHHRQGHGWVLWGHQNDKDNSQDPTPPSQFQGQMSAS